MKAYKQTKDIKVAALGYGPSFHMGRAHLREMAQAGMTPVAVCDIDPARLVAAEEEFPGIQTYGHVNELLKKCDVDLVAVITPHNTHAKLALACLNAGRHVVTEKPFSVTTAECDAMIAAAKKNKVMLSTYHNRHWDGCILNAMKHIGSGAIGEVVRVEGRMCGYNKPGDWWRTSKTISGGIMYDWGVHILEYTLQIANSDIVEVTGFAKRGFWAPSTPWKEDTNEDEGQAVVRFSSGAWASLTISSIESNPKRGMVEVTGTKGSYIFDCDTYEMITHDGADTVVKKGKNPPGEGWAFYQNIADHLTKNEKLIISAEWARRPIHIIDLAYQSAKKGKAIAAKYK